ncbi:Uncharacterised protein (plasmid) [Tsukamurella tyrosinosolvens]|uniref:Uncharacterized protein n=1 Tax=Tsukamurella tyrosinosolvens TaxID=57704 RepID=A0A1H4UGZ3_TSUTY|nr:hypothetical protein [Tsukamurella tyrosinosolvens]KXO92920.1 hypothetical protein AXK58_13690 [Tsukamurella tyrosinosolvens]SEC68017.1 hypothetical protein SAMN04489793_2900 [Tsukamurella tyrosinosolvens]VEH94221.1 Uncharacterised protein [Tsukamurella tyrosinosolvens]
MSDTGILFEVYRDGTPQWRARNHLVQLSGDRVRVYRVIGDDVYFDEMPQAQVRTITPGSGHDQVLIDMVAEAHTYHQTHPESS